MKRISRNLTAAALASSLALAGATAANAEENTDVTVNDAINAITEAGNTDTTTDTENGGTEGDNETTPGEGETTPGDDETTPGEGETTPGDDENPGEGEKPGDDEKPGENKEKSSFDDIKAKLSSEEGKPTDLGIAAIVLGVLGAIAAAVPAAAQALNIKLPF